ncbi:hypothetical protein [Klebsiella pneumoniae]
MYKNNDEAIDLEAKRLLDNGIYTDLEKAYREAPPVSGLLSPLNNHYV